MAMRTRGEVMISRALLALALISTLVSAVEGEQQHAQPCEGVITKPYMRGSGSPCVNPGRAVDFAATATEETTTLLPSRRMLGSGDAAGTAGGIIITVIIIVAIAWCCYTGRCCYGRQTVLVMPPSAANSTAVASTTSNPVTVTVPVTIGSQQAPESKAPTIQYNYNYAAPAPGGDVEMAATAIAGNSLAHTHAGNGHMGGVPVGFHPVHVPAPAPGFPAYAPPPQHTPSLPQQAHQPNPLSNYPSDKSPGPKNP